jgi:TonB family protein
MRKIKDYDRARNKRLIALTPIGLLFILVILISLEQSQVVERLFTVGFEGPMELLPEITIIDEQGIESDVTAEERHAMVAREVEYETEEIEQDDDPNRITSELSEKTPDEISLDELGGDSFYRSYESHARVPYHEDYIILKMVKPTYPPDALALGLEGYVVAELYVDETGKVSGAWVRSSYGSIEFEEASLKAVQQFLFKPVMEYGEPVPFWISFLIRFKCRR